MPGAVGQAFMLRSIKRQSGKIWIPAITWCEPRWFAANAIAILAMCLPMGQRRPVYVTASTQHQFSSLLKKNNAMAAVVNKRLPFCFSCIIAPKGLIL
jgi:hypothetical protein